MCKNVWLKRILHTWRTKVRIRKMQRLHNIPAVENGFLRLNNNTEILTAE